MTADGWPHWHPCMGNPVNEETEELVRWLGAVVDDVVEQCSPTWENDDALRGLVRSSLDRDPVLTQDTMAEVMTPLALKIARMDGPTAISVLISFRNSLAMAVAAQWPNGAAYANHYSEAIMSDLIRLIEGVSR